MARPVTMAATPKPSTGPVSCGFGTRHSVLTTTRTVSVRDENADADAKRGRVQRTEGIHPEGRAQSTRDGSRGQLAVLDVLAGLDQHEAEGQDGDRVDHDHDGLRIEIEQHDTGVVVRPNPKPMAPMVNPATASTSADTAISIGPTTWDRSFLSPEDAISFLPSYEFRSHERGRHPHPNPLPRTGEGAVTGSPGPP